MKYSKIAFSASIFLTFLFFSGNILAQTQDEKSRINENEATVKFKELIIGVPKISIKTYQLLIDIVSEIEDIKYDSFCEKHKLILLTYNPVKYQRPEEVIQAINDKDFNLQLLLKEGNFINVKEMCSEN